MSATAKRAAPSKPSCPEQANRQHIQQCALQATNNCCVTMNQHAAHPAAPNCSPSKPTVSTCTTVLHCFSANHQRQLHLTNSMQCTLPRPPAPAWHVPALCCPAPPPAAQQRATAARSRGSASALAAAAARHSTAQNGSHMAHQYLPWQARHVTHAPRIKLGLQTLCLLTNRCTRTTGGRHQRWQPPWTACVFTGL